MAENTDEIVPTHTTDEITNRSGEGNSYIDQTSKLHGQLDTKKKPRHKGNKTPVPIIVVTCGGNEGKFDLRRFFGVRLNARCIQLHDSWLTTNEFREKSGFDKKHYNWKKVIKHYGESLQTLEKQGNLMLGSVKKDPAPEGCSCHFCCPVRCRDIHFLFNTENISFHCKFFYNLR